MYVWSLRGRPRGRLAARFLPELSQEAGGQGSRVPGEAGKPLWIALSDIDSNRPVFFIPYIGKYL